MPSAPSEFDECSIREVFRNHMTRHVPPAQASPEQIVLRAEVIHLPLAFAGDPLLCLFPIGLIVGYDELDVSSNQPFPCYAYGRVLLADPLSRSIHSLI